MTLTEQFIGRLEALKEGELAQLRRLAGKPLDETLQGFDLFTGLWWPLRQSSPRAPERRSAWLVAKLYGDFPLPLQLDEQAEVAKVLGRRERALRDEFDNKRFRRRFDALLQSPLSELEPHLKWALSVIHETVAKRHIQGVDWVRLLDDLRLWVRGPDKHDRDHRRCKRDIRDIWAEDYLNAAHQSERSANHAD